MSFSSILKCSRNIIPTKVWVGNEPIKKIGSFAKSLRPTTYKSEDYEELHPRYPVGSPDGKGGKFMPKGSPEYNAAIAKSHERFSAQKYVVGRNSNEDRESYNDTSDIQKEREGYQIAKKVLFKPETLEEYKNEMASIEVVRKKEGETAGRYSTPNPKNSKERIYTEERKKVHDKILADIFKDAHKFEPPKGQKPEYVLLGGVGGAGKSSFGEGDSKVYDKNTHLVLDNDSIKAMLPNYEAGKAFLYHIEAGDILREAKKIALARKLNVVIDATMKAPVEDEIKSAQAAGYGVQVHFMHLSPKEAAGRAVSRWLNLDAQGKPTKDKNGNIVRGRLVPPHVILGMTTSVKNFDKAKKLVDHWSFRRNNVPKGAKPVVVLSKT